MIVSEKGIWKKVLPVYGKSPAVTLVASFAAAYGVEKLGWGILALPTEPFSIVGTGLSILMIFRNNEAYNRYWEARTLWGEVMASLRTFSRLSLTLLRPDASQDGPHDDRVLPPELLSMRREWVYRGLAFFDALRTSLRGESASELDYESLKKYLPPEEIETLRAQKNGPCAILHTQSERLADAWRADLLHPQHVALLDEQLAALTLSYGGCEKIARTPMFPSYSFIARSFVWLFVILLPFGLVAQLGWRTLVIAPFIAFLFGALQRFGEEIQHPFGTQHDAVPLDSLARQLEIELRQRLGEKVEDLPAELKPKDEILL